MAASIDLSNINFSLGDPINAPLNDYNFSVGASQKDGNPNVSTISLEGLNISGFSGSTDNYVAETYQKMSLFEHVYRRPDMYIGSIEKIMRPERLMDFSNPNVPKFIDSMITFPDGFERLFIEILANSSDNVIKSRNHGYPIGEIEVECDQFKVSIKNGGIPIPIRWNSTENMWEPQLIFANLLTSSNYDDKKERSGIGKNGLGAKLTNRFSKYFEVYLGNPHDRKTCKMVCRDNMTIVEPPVIEENYDGPSFTKITFIADFEYFEYQSQQALGINSDSFVPEDRDNLNSQSENNELDLDGNPLIPPGYPPEALTLFARYSAESAFACKVPVTFNGYRFRYQNILDFSKLICNPEHDNYIVYYEYPSGTKLKNKRLPNGMTIEVAEDSSIVPKHEICILDTPNQGQFASYVNGGYTREGGVHVDKVYRTFCNKVLEKINDSIKSKKEKDIKLSRKFKLELPDIKRHCTIVVSCKLPDPGYTSQSKTKLTRPEPKFSIKKDTIEKLSNKMGNWEMINKLTIDLHSKLNRELLKGTGKRKKYLDINGLKEAHFAGNPKEAYKCVLYGVEGKSAMGYAHTFKSDLTDEQKDYVGIFCLMGKPMNVRNAKMFKYINSKKIKNFIEVLGLEDGIDYQLDENYHKLRYGHLVLLTDADVDGIHISGLILNMLHYRFPTLLMRRDFMIMKRTPIIRVKKGKQTHDFYSQKSFDDWTISNSDYSKWEIKYCKGLASSDNEEVSRDSKNPKMTNFIYDESTDAYFNLAFHVKQADSRKRWIAEYQLVPGIEDIPQLGLSQFLNFELVQYAITNLSRSIPRFDGFKISTRKILFGAMDKWKKSVGSDKAKLMKVNRLSGHIGEVSNYHYGEASLIGAINRMALDYPGTNNLALFHKGGQFGTRDDDGKDAGDGRYISTRLMWWIPYIFRKEDDAIITYVLDEGESYEPEVYLPILPIFMVNGALGIGSGSSTFIPNFNVIDLVQSIKCLIVDSELPELKPWYRDFAGSIHIVTKDNISVNAGISNSPINIELSGINLDLLDQEDDEDDENENRNSSDKNLEDIGLADIETNDDGDPMDNDGSMPITLKPGLKIITCGDFEIIDNKTLRVTELPIGKSFIQYEKTLKKWIEDKEIKDYKNHSKHAKPNFLIIGYGKHKTLDSLKLTKSFSMTNMILLDLENRPIKFKDQYDLVRRWYQWRLPYYQKRKDYLLKQKYDQIEDKINKMKFINAVIQGYNSGYVQGQTVIVVNKPKKEILEQMSYIGLSKPPEKYLTGAKVSNLSSDDIAKLQQKIQQLSQEYQILQKRTPGDIWIQDLNEFLNVYLRRYPDEKIRAQKYEMSF